MTSKEAYEFGKVIIATIKHNPDSEVVTKSALRGMTRRMYEAEIIIRVQRDWLNGQILKVFGVCKSNHYILGKRVYKSSRERKTK